MIALKERIEAQGLSQANTAKLFGVAQPRISDWLRGKITLFSINMLATAGLPVERHIAQAV